MRVVMCVILFTLGYWSGLITTCAAVAGKVSANKKGDDKGDDNG